MNNVRVDDAGRRVTTGDAIEGRFTLVRVGKKRYHLIGLTG